MPKFTVSLFFTISFLFTNSVFAQINISGNIKDNYGNTIEGAVISIKSLNLNTISNNNGFFKIENNYLRNLHKPV